MGTTEGTVRTNGAPSTLSTRQPSGWLVTGIVAAYATIFTGWQLFTGIPYKEMFTTASNAWHGPVAGLAIGAVFLLLVHACTRWSYVSKDAVRLPMRWPLWLALGGVTVAIGVRFAVVSWSSVTLGLVVPILVAGLLVGLTEELLFRGFVLRALRGTVRREGVAVLLTALVFGAMHLLNILQGNSIGQGVAQFALAGLLGVSLYLARRATGLLVVAMAVHAVWDISSFLPGGNASLNMGVSVLSAIIGLAALVSVVRHDRTPAIVGAVRTWPRCHRSGTIWPS
jgi:membrane protease YdiL (CAAX protease family)